MFWAVEMQNSWPKFPSIVEEEHTSKIVIEILEKFTVERRFITWQFFGIPYFVSTKKCRQFFFSIQTLILTLFETFLPFLGHFYTLWKQDENGIAAAPKSQVLNFFWKVCHASAMPLTKNDRNSIRTLFGSTFTRSRFCGYTRQIIIIKDFCGGTKTISLKCSVRFESWRKNFVFLKARKIVLIFK